MKCLAPRRHLRTFENSSVLRVGISVVGVIEQAEEYRPKTVLVSRTF